MLKDKFDIYYNIEGAKRYIAPMLLPEKEPKYADFGTENNLHFRHQYPFMPEGIISRLIVRLNHLIENKHVWKNGVVLRNDNHFRAGFE